jgi:predicted DNA-binding transcriptional regulator AlpA
MKRLVYNSKETCELLGISKSTLLRITAAKRLNKIKLSDKRIGWSHQEILRFIGPNDKQLI